MTKRSMMALAAGALVAAMVPGAALADGGCPPTFSPNFFPSGIGKLPIFNDPVGPGPQYVRMGDVNGDGLVCLGFRTPGFPVIVLDNRY